MSTEGQPFPFPSIYSFPPFFTRQPNSQTWTSQLSLWSSLILGYCRYNRIWRIDLNTAIEWDLFSNKEINRLYSCFRSFHGILGSMVELMM